MTTDSHKSDSAEESEEETDVDVTPFVTPKKAKKSVYPSMPAPTKVTKKKSPLPRPNLQQSQNIQLRKRHKNL